MLDFINNSTYLASIVITLDNVLITLLVVIAGVFFFLKRKKFLLDYIITIIFATFTSETLKYFISIERPTETLMNISFSDNSFPSTHTTIAFAVATYTSLKFLKKEKRSIRQNIATLTLVTLAIGVGILRLLVGAHYISDIIIGGIIGAFIALIFNRVDFNIQILKKKN